MNGHDFPEQFDSMNDAPEDVQAEYNEYLATIARGGVTAYAAADLFNALCDALEWRADEVGR